MRRWKERRWKELGAILPSCLAIAMAAASCERPPTSGQENQKAFADSDIELLTRPGCAGSSVMRDRLKSVLADSGTDVVVVEQETLPSGDPRRGYPTPTVLVDGTDLFGMEEPKQPLAAPS